MKIQRVFRLLLICFLICMGGFVGSAQETPPAEEDTGAPTTYGIGTLDTSQPVELRVGPSMDYGPIIQVPPQTEVIVLGEVDNETERWVLIELADGVQGFIPGSDITITTAPLENITSNDALVNANNATATQVVVGTATRTANLAATDAANATATQNNANFSATATQLVANATATQASASANATATAVATYPNFVVVVGGPTETELSIGDTVPFVVSVTNTGGSELRGRVLELRLNYDQNIFSNPEISPAAKSQSIGVITWNISEPFMTGDVKSFNVQLSVRQDLNESRSGNVQAVVLSQSLQELACSQVVTTRAIVEANPAQTQDSQGTGLFKDPRQFAFLIGGFFIIQILIIIALAYLVFTHDRSTMNHEQAFTSIIDILILMSVLFAVIVMAVQNAIDRESVNAIIGGIVGYVAGRASGQVKFIPSGGIAPPNQLPSGSQGGDSGQNNPSNGNGVNNEEDKV